MPHQIELVIMSMNRAGVPVSDLREGSMRYERISIDPQICSGKPCIRGTRIMVTNILGLIAGGYSNEQIVQTYPELTREDIAAALDYVSQVVDEDKVIPRA